MEPEIKCENISNVGIEGGKIAVTMMEGKIYKNVLN